MTEPFSNPAPFPRRIRSFVRREGRLTPGQQNALERLWPRYGLLPGQRLDPTSVFGRRAPLTLEIGFGNGRSLAAMAAAEPTQDFIGIEVHRPGVGQLLQALDAGALGNVRVYCHDALEILHHCLDDASLERVLLLFPDPWPKKKHHKRRIVQPEFAALIARKLKPGGLFHLATDWQPYAHHMRQVLDQCPQLAPDAAGANPRAPRPRTKFEQRGERLGHRVSDLFYRRRS